MAGGLGPPRCPHCGHPVRQRIAVAWLLRGRMPCCGRPLDAALAVQLTVLRLLAK